MAVVPEKVQTKKKEKEKEKDKTAAGADEFGGPLGAACITLFLPLLSLLLSEACSEPALGEVPRRADRHVTALIASAGSCSINALPRRLAFRFSSLVANGVSVDSIMTAIGVVLGYLGFTLALHCLLPGERALGAAQLCVEQRSVERRGKGPRRLPRCDGTHQGVMATTKV